MAPTHGNQRARTWPFRLLGLLLVVLFLRHDALMAGASPHRPVDEESAHRTPVFHAGPGQARQDLGNVEPRHLDQSGIG